MQQEGGFTEALIVGARTDFAPHPDDAVRDEPHDPSLRGASRGRVPAFSVPSWPGPISNSWHWRLGHRTSTVAAPARFRRRETMQTRPSMFARSYFHGTRADLKPGDLIVVGHPSNFADDRALSWVYFALRTQKNCGTSSDIQ
jgi:hypothetical protein